MTPDDKPIRSFIAIPLPAQIKTAAGKIQDRLKQSLPQVRWTRPESMHLTLHFFGDLDQENLEKATAVMVSIESLFSPFFMTFSGVGAFPSPDQARVFWLGVKSDRLADLHTVLNDRLNASGFPCEKRPFKPHLTLGRSRSGAQQARHILSLESATVAAEMTVDTLALYESELLPTGAVHRARQLIHFTAD